MSTLNFTEWLEHRESLNESHGPQAGDRAYFGIHDLMRNDFSPEVNTDKMGEIVDVDPIEEKIKVVVGKDPFHMGYHRLESSKDRKKRKKMSKDDRVELMIPSQHFKDISGMMMGDGPKTWLVVDRNTKYQQGLNKKLNKFMHKEPEPEADIAPQDHDDVDYMTAEPDRGNFKMMNREVFPLPARQPQPPMGQLGWKRHADPRTYGYV